MEQAEHVLKLTNKRKAAWARRRWATDPEWREMKKAAWRSRYYKLKELKGKHEQTN
jgi:hypothetical protein